MNSRISQDLAILIFFGIVSLAAVPIEAGWFGPDSYAECMKEELKDAENENAEKYIRDYCFEKFCRDKGQVLSAENELEKTTCQELIVAYSDIEPEWEKKNCTNWISKKNCESGCRPRYLTKEQPIIITGSRWKCCWCREYAKRLKQINQEYESLQCEDLADEVYVYDDKTCPD